MKASDFPATIKRDYKIDSPGVGFFSNIVGADDFAKSKKGEISGIVANDATGKITIKLEAAAGRLPVHPRDRVRGARCPQNSPAKDQSTTPLPATGPYMIQSYKPNKQVIVVRNPNFDASMSTERAGREPGQDDDRHHRLTTRHRAHAVLNGQDDYDFQQPPSDRLADLQANHADQIKLYTPANTYYYFMNNRSRRSTTSRCGRRSTSRSTVRRSCASTAVSRRRRRTCCRRRIRSTRS